MELNNEQVKRIDQGIAKRVIEDLWDSAFEQGRNAVKPARGEEALKQIDRMARQIEECHSTIRRRNEEIKNLEADVRLLSNQACCCKGDN